jgi:hypothetical protein
MLLSLTGDYFAAERRARFYARIAARELVGSGFGFLVSGNVAGLLSWRPRCCWRSRSGGRGPRRRGAGGGLLLLAARRSYPRDVATALAGDAQPREAPQARRSVSREGCTRLGSPGILG